MAYSPVIKRGIAVQLPVRKTPSALPSAADESVSDIDFSPRLIYTDCVLRGATMSVRPESW